MIRIVFLLLLLASYACASTFTCQEGVSGPANCGNLDNLMYNGTPDTPYGSHVNYGSGTIAFTTLAYRTLVEFDLTSITGATISACVLTVDVEVGAVTSTAGTTNRIRRADWDEATATWNSYKTSSTWTTAGAASTASDIDTANQVGFSAPTATGSFAFPDMTSLCQDALDVQSNRLRFRIAQNVDANSPATDTYFLSTSSDGATAANRPLLTVTYTGGGVSLGTRMRKFFGVGRRGPRWPEDYEPHPFQFFIPWEDR